MIFGFSGSYCNSWGVFWDILTFYSGSGEAICLISDSVNDYIRGFTWATCESYDCLFSIYYSTFFSFISGGLNSTSTLNLGDYFIGDLGGNESSVIGLATVEVFYPSFEYTNSDFPYVLEDLRGVPAVSLLLGTSVCLSVYISRIYGMFLELF